MKHPDNIRDVVSLKPDYLGFIFYPASKRFVDNSLAEKIVSQVPATIKKVGVFVNATKETIFETIQLFSLDLVQLHGTESPALCKEIGNQGTGVIKAFGIDKHFDFNQLQNYQDVCDFFLFDTRTQLHGGSGIKFEWELLKTSNNSKPFLLSGGIGPEDADSIRKNTHLELFAVDINSRFETEPAV